MHEVHVKPPLEGMLLCKAVLARYAAAVWGQVWQCDHRRDFGNNPDISKALRLLVSEKRVKRVGKGGRADPFTYQVIFSSEACVQI